MRQALSTRFSTREFKKGREMEMFSLFIACDVAFQSFGRNNYVVLSYLPPPPPEYKDR